MKQRLGIAIALVHEPDLLILDEPTNGLDPQGIADMRALILSLSKEHGKTVLISSHLLHEVEQVATRMLVLHKGKKVVEGSVKDLMSPNETVVDITILPNPEIKAKIIGSNWKGHLETATDTSLTFKLHNNDIPLLCKWLVEHEAGIMEVKSKHSLEAYFLSLTND
jgi:ABC-type multidrug transport system ATPase subunit